MGSEWLDTWKEIASLLGVCVRTAQRYSLAGMPVLHPKGMRVKAIRHDIVEWKKRYIARLTRKKRRK